MIIEQAHVGVDGQKGQLPSATSICLYALDKSMVKNDSSWASTVKLHQELEIDRFLDATGGSLSS